MNSKPRTPTTKAIETDVLTASQRKCCLCYYLGGIRTHRKGQIAHLNQDRSDSSFENLVWLCLEHHDEFDSRTSQSKGFTMGEVAVYRDRLYSELGSHTDQKVLSQSDHGTPIVVRHLPQELKDVLSKEKPQLDWILAPWDLAAHDDVRSFLFPYKASNHADGVCQVERYCLRDGRVAVICRQLPNNPGQSVSNSIEEIAFQICAQFQIPAADLVLIDYYPNRSSRGSNYTLVAFQQRPPEGMFAGPSWKEMTELDWRSLGLRPRASGPGS